MCAANIVHSICIRVGLLEGLPIWRFISRRNTRIKLKEDVGKFLKLDIYDASNNFITFLLGFDKYYTKNLLDIKFNDSYLHITLDNIGVGFYPKHNRFEIDEEDISYMVYRNTICSTRIKKRWDPITEKLKQRYVEIILDLAKYIANPPFQ